MKYKSMALCLGVCAMLCVRESHACTICAVGDESIVQVGVEPPRQGRMRFALSSEGRSLSQGEQGTPSFRAVDEIRNQLSLSYAVYDGLTAVLALPLVHREYRLATGRTYSGTGMGDLYVGGRILLFPWLGRMREHGLSLQLGMTFPSAPVLHVEGRQAPFEVQPGSGSWTPSASVSYVWMRGDYQWFSHIEGRFPIGQRLSEQGGMAFLWSSTFQWNALRWMAFGMGFEGRHELPARDAEGDVPHTGSTALKISPSLLLSPWSWFMCRVGVRVPLWEDFNGIQSESLAWHVSLAGDWSF